MNDVREPPATMPRADHAWVAAGLSFVFPGLGQAYAGRRLAAVVFALPILILVAIVAGLLSGAIKADQSALLSTGFLVALLALNGAVMAWRAAAITHAGLWPLGAVRERERRTATLLTALLVALTVGMHAWVGVVVVNLEQTLSEVFGGPIPGVRTPGSILDPGGSSPGAEASQAPAPTDRWNGTERINILLLGTDAAPGRDTVLTDVILVVSVDPVDESAAMISVPRDTGFVPLADESIHEGGLFPDKVNALLATAASDPERWCPDRDPDDGAGCGLRTVEEAIGLYLGIEIHHYALVDMAGFAELIDALGGLDLCLPGQLVDPEFDGSLENADANEPLVLPAGCHAYDGLDALAYARSRKGWIEMPDGTREPQNDFTRADRQQRVLLALRREMAQADTLFELPAVLGAIGRTVSTDFPRDQAGELASLVPLITGPDIERLVLSHPEYVDLPTQPEINYLLIPRRDAIRDRMADLFGADELKGWYLGGTEGRPGTGAPFGLP